MTTTMTTKDWPTYQCHKKVYAVKIRAFELDLTKDEVLAIPQDPEIESIDIDMDLLKKHKPGPGWYFVAYEDGYESFSPAEAFEAGYTEIPPA